MRGQATTSEPCPSDSSKRASEVTSDRTPLTGVRSTGTTMLELLVVTLIVMTGWVILAGLTIGFLNLAKLWYRAKGARHGIHEPNNPRRNDGN